MRYLPRLFHVFTIQCIQGTHALSGHLLKEFHSVYRILHGSIKFSDSPLATALLNPVEEVRRSIVPCVPLLLSSTPPVWWCKTSMQPHEIYE